MSVTIEDERVLSALEALFDDLERSQRRRVRRVADKVNPRLTSDDLMNPHDFPALVASPEFSYEDGYLAGLVAARVALRATLYPHPDEVGRG